MLIKPLSTALLLIICSSVVQAAQRISGPMVGYGDMHSVRIWLQADSAQNARIEYWRSGKPALKHLSPAVALLPTNDYAAQVHLNALEPGQSYVYRVLLDDQVIGSTYHFNTQARWQWRNGVEPPDFSALFGSCVYINEVDKDRAGKPYGGDYQIFGAMAAKKPDLTLWLGDNVYFRENDYSSASGMAHRYRHDRATPELQRLLQTGQHVAIWDDHDYGPNNSNSSFVFKQDALRLFQRYWANASYGLPDAPGIFGTFSFNDVDFFLLDDRWYRDADKAHGISDKQMFGAAQLRWLKNALLNSTATFKVIASGSQILNDFNRFEGWLNFPKERKEFFDWLNRNPINGMVFLSGDRHHTSLVKTQRAGAYPLYDFTCSPLTSTARDVDDERRNPQLVSGTLVGERNFCSLTFSGPRQQRQLTLKSYDKTGKLLWERRLRIDELSYKK